MDAVYVSDIGGRKFLVIGYDAHPIDKITNIRLGIVSSYCPCIACITVDDRGTFEYRGETANALQEFLSANRSQTQIGG